MNDADQSVGALVERAGWFRDCEATPIGGTGNNAVFRVEAAGRRYVVKRYFQHPGDSRDRFATERAFYTFLWQAGLRWTPEPLAWDAGLRLALFEHVVGLRPTQATPELIAAAMAFFAAINAQRFTESASALPLASEACFSVSEHLERVGRRIERLEGVASDSEIGARATEFVAEELKPAWTAICARAHAAADRSAHERVLDSAERCLSPSDFGFHNSLLTPDGDVRFLDFEYAGWDDPAKVVCDFFCQPAVPVPDTFLDEVFAGLGDFHTPELRQRVSILLPAYRIKWCCIMLNDFLPADHSRRTFSDPGHDPTARRALQLEMAKRALRAIDR